MAKLTSDKWVDAGLAALAEGGVENVRIEPLARKLGATKGSFYWHFADRGALLAAVRKAWEESQTGNIIEAIELEGGTPRAKLHRLVTRIGTMNVGLEAAMRRWAATDADVREQVVKIDTIRIGHLKSVIESAGVSAEHALDRARLLYHAFVGEVAFGRPVSDPERATTAQSIQDLILRST